MGERGLGIRSGAPKQGWEESEFPILCESCLGDNPYIRMLKHPLGRECKVCSRPFTVFKWKAGTQGRFKKTEICQTCAKLKNVCQTCLFDLQYGLPVEIRDKFLGDSKVNIPVCEGNRDYWSQLATQNIEQLALPYDKMANPILSKLARTGPHYERNKPHICTFWQKGECTRGNLCQFRHEAGPDLLTPHNIKDRFYGVNDPVAKNILSTIEHSRYVKPPEDKNVQTLVVSLLDSDMLPDLQALMAKYGPLSDATLLHNHAFLTFTTRRAAEEAIKNTFSSLVVRGKQLTVVWAKKTTHASDSPGLVLPDCTLVPSFSSTLDGAAPPLPRHPPVEVQTPQEQNSHVVRLLGESSRLSDYAAAKTDSFGGTKPSKSLNLVNY